MKNKSARTIVLFIGLLFLQGGCLAEVYKYKDESGRWQFSDKPKKGSQAALLGGYKAKASAIVDIEKQLNMKYQPTSSVQRATLAVVTINSKLGSGSGFFVSADCYLITNKHVIRPAAGKSWDATQRKLKKNAAEFERTRRKLQHERQRLALSKQKLDDFKRYLEGLTSASKKQLAQQEYAVHVDRYQQEERYIDDFAKRFNENERAFNKQRSNFDFSSSLANVARSFELTLKDNTKLQASLIKVSSSDDLALLKVKACKSPFLVLSAKRLSQGVTVHAIGSPLGLRDQLTRGTVTQVLSNGVVTDAQIMPGNSGGPLVNDEGEVVAVNTLKVAQGSALNKGFGVSIPVARLRENFSLFLR